MTEHFRNHKRTIRKIAHITWLRSASIIVLLSLCLPRFGNSSADQADRQTVVQSRRAVAAAMSVDRDPTRISSLRLRQVQFSVEIASIGCMQRLRQVAMPVERLP